MHTAIWLESFTALGQIANGTLVGLPVIVYHFISNTCFLLFLLFFLHSSLLFRFVGWHRLYGSCLSCTNAHEWSIRSDSNRPAQEPRCHRLVAMGQRPSIHAPGPNRGGFPVGWLGMGCSRLRRRAYRRRSETGDSPHLTIANPTTALLLDGDRSASLSLTGLVCDLTSAVLKFQAGIPLEWAHWHWGPFLLEALPMPSLPICRGLVSGHSPAASLDPDPLVFLFDGEWCLPCLSYVA
ncbi:hypothetical protein QBC36DRAFT_15624 [Triangularia setosa]|uniref:Uncharacterized protein n=1 Tax=Triangularia setosa TaxID=2587417 RepID=A0AAN6WF89_9PEZI|nr:hypothetical protein QBC36DRAFT_15624 [Podospora setosa]